MFFLEVMLRDRKTPVIPRGGARIVPARSMDELVGIALRTTEYAPVRARVWRPPASLQVLAGNPRVRRLAESLGRIAGTRWEETTLVERSIEPQHPGAEAPPVLLLLSRIEKIRLPDGWGIKNGPPRNDQFAFLRAEPAPFHAVTRNGTVIQPPPGAGRPDLWLVSEIVEALLREEAGRDGRPEDYNQQVEPQREP